MAAGVLYIAVAGCGSVQGSAAAGDAGSGGGGSNDGGGTPQCGARGQMCCSGNCNLRASCDGTSCIAADVWASGADGIANFNGGSWINPLLTGSTAELPAVNGLWGTTANFVVGVGNGGLIVRNDGASWHRDVAATTGAPALFGVAGSSATDVWAVGDAFSHYNGNSWASVASPSTTQESFIAVWLSGPGEGWAVGDSGQIAQLTGGTWTLISRQGGNFGLSGVWGSGANDVWMVGTGHNLTGNPAQVRHFNGQTFDGVGNFAQLGALPPLNAVWGSDANHVFAVGDAGTVVVWNGSLWRQLDSKLTDNLNAVWGSGPSDVWIAGTAGAHHFDGTKFESVGTLTSPPTTIWLSVD